jgi:hypothetical protein
MQFFGGNIIENCVYEVKTSVSLQWLAGSDLYSGGVGSNLCWDDASPDRYFMISSALLGELRYSTESR